jgi:hypothetical protein
VQENWNEGVSLINKGKNIMTQSNINMDMVINISLGSFTQQQLKVMLCETMNNLTTVQIEAVLAKIGMVPADLTK